MGRINEFELGRVSHEKMQEHANDVSMMRLQSKGSKFTAHADSVKKAAKSRAGMNPTPAETMVGRVPDQKAKWQ